MKISVLLALAAWGSAAVAFGRQCQPSWSNTFSGVNGLGTQTGTCVVVFDEDGAGPRPPAVFVGGQFTVAGGVSTLYVARWDGASWSAVGDGLPGPPTALVVHDDDGPGPHQASLYACGSPHGYGYVLRWDGTTWSSVGGEFGSNSDLEAMVSFDDDGDGPDVPGLYVGGQFMNADGHPSPNIAKWDGSSWGTVGGGASGQVRTLAVFDPDGDGPALAKLAAGGLFQTIGGVAAPLAALWDGHAWASIGPITGSSILKLVAFDVPATGAHRLYASGFCSFPSAGGAISNLAGWDGAAWSATGWPAGVGTPLGVAALDGAGPAGLLTLGGSAGANTLWYWDGAVWSQIAGPLSYPVIACASFDPDGGGPAPQALVVAGAFSTIEGVAARSVAQRANGAWSAMGGGVAGPDGGWVYSLCPVATDVGGVVRGLYAGGNFSFAGETLARNIARWDGVRWSPVGSGSTTPVTAMTMYDPDGLGPRSPVLVASGGSPGGPFPYMGAWDGQSWSSLGQGLDQPVYALAVFDEDGAGPNPPALFAGGTFTASSPTTLPGIARWNGAAWSPVGPASTFVSVFALTVYDDGHGPALYAGGTFGAIGGVSASGIARWNGSAWSPLGTGVGGSTSTVNALAVFDDDGPGPNPPRLYVGGRFSSAGGVPASNVARWDGSSWSAVGAGFLGSLAVRSLAVFDDGNGPALYAAGDFSSNGTVSVSHVARWDGAAWLPLGTGLAAPGYALAVSDPGGVGRSSLLVGGTFAAAGGARATGLASWGCAAAGCYANCDNSATPPVLNVNDFICFLNRFAAADPYANCDGSTTPPVLNVLDFTCFLNHFAAGCG